MLEKTVERFSPPKLGVRVQTGNMALSYGALVWWSVSTGVYDHATLTKSAGELKLPPVFLDQLIGAVAKQAWEKATYIRDTGIVSAEPDKDCTARYVQKDVEPGVRLLVREKISKSQRVLSVAQLGTLYFDGGFKFEPDPPYQLFKGEAEYIVSQMSADYAARIGQVDDNKVRQILLAWLNTRNRIIVRKSGGVYYLPYGGKFAIELAEEINQVNQWLRQNEIGDLTSVEIYESPATTLESIIEAAEREIDEEVAFMEEKLGNLVAQVKETTTNGHDKIYAQKVGSFAYTSASYVNTLDALKEKLCAAQSALGQNLGVLEYRVDMAQKQATAIKQKSNSKLAEWQAEKGKSVKAVTAPKVSKKRRIGVGGKTRVK